MPLLRKSSEGKIAPVASLLIDVINDFDFDRADELLVQARPMPQRLAALKREASRLEIPAIYVKDNFGQWQSDLHDGTLLRWRFLGGESSRMLRPAESDYFVLKPKHSGFYATTLDLLLDHIWGSNAHPDRHRR